MDKYNTADYFTNYLTLKIRWDCSLVTDLDILHHHLLVQQILCGDACQEEQRSVRQYSIQIAIVRNVGLNIRNTHALKENQIHSYPSHT